MNRRLSLVSSASAARLSQRICCGKRARHQHNQPEHQIGCQRESVLTGAYAKDGGAPNGERVGSHQNDEQPYPLETSPPLAYDAPAIDWAADHLTTNHPEHKDHSKQQTAQFKQMGGGWRAAILVDSQRAQTNDCQPPEHLDQRQDEKAFPARA